MYQYKIQSIQMHPEGYFLVHVSLDPKNKHIIVLKFMNGFIEDLINGAPSEEKIKNKLKELLTESDDLYLIRLTRIALGNELIKEELRKRKNGIFDIDYIKWKRIVNKIEEEELELILAQGLSNI
jgi:hypothetical protein